MYLILIGVLLILLYFRKSIIQRWFAWFCNQWNKTKDAKYEELKKNLFNKLDSCVSYFPELRKQNTLKILEIGVGTGVNFDYYPTGTRLVVVDQNPYFKKYYNENRSKFPNIHSEEIVVSMGEEMDMIESNSVDVVVTTLVLCSVKDINKILKQIHRVLVPGGKYIFFEHVREWDDKAHPWRQKIQDFLTGIRIWPTLFDGCELNRELTRNIKSTGFNLVNEKNFYAPINNFFFQVVKPHLSGTAVK